MRADATSADDTTRSAGLDGRVLCSTTMGQPATAAPLRAMTLEDWGALPEDEAGELVDGVLEDDEMAGWAHEVVVTWLIAVLAGWAKSARARVAASDAKLGVSAQRGRKGDVLVYLAGDRRPPGHGIIRVPPSIVVEVVSPSPTDARRDRIQKLDDYAAFGVRWYWIVDPQLRTVEIFELGADGRYARAIGASEGRLAHVPGCVGLELDVDAMWADLDAALAEAEPTNE